MDPSTSGVPAPVTELVPIDVSMVQDDGMKALIMLARSLGWNTHHKHNQPVVITSREGIQRRIPTSTSVRASYFQSNLSSIILNSALEPTVDLIEAIIKAVKPSADHARRLRVAVGESPQQHRERLMNAEFDPEELLMPPVVDQGLVWEEPPPSSTSTPERRSERNQGVQQEEGNRPIPADREDHGKLLQQRTHLARSSLHQNKDGTWSAKVYESNSSDERLWEDGYVDFVCKFCDKAYGTSRGVGSHKQVHIAEGVVKADSQELEAKAWRVVQPEDLWEQRRTIGTRRKKAELEVVEEAPTDQVVADVEHIIQVIKDLLFPEVEKRAVELMAVVDQLNLENEDLRSKYNKVSGDLKALRDLIGGMGDT